MTDKILNTAGATQETHSHTRVTKERIYRLVVYVVEQTKRFDIAVLSGTKKSEEDCDVLVTGRRRAPFA